MSKYDIGKTEQYWKERGIRLDWRGHEKVHIHKDSKFGYSVVMMTGTHDPHPVRFHGSGGNTRPLIIEKDAWIASYARLFNCHIGEGAVVAYGAVVRSRMVPPWTMVEGNPAQIIARFDHDLDKWIYLDEPEPLMRLFIKEERESLEA